ncbi:hypothetical protein [Chryseosolibacter indicus]|uniref:Lipoprotein n=1 Tax=Chryseosolibacter indicus TaxID=2782351 RepID=A0ABS5VXW9_9BACT|nr:hypothetical protein [Chryseosolibacter indicus]MBT1705697.1 hypothetical protein [Chryseosolibacter indicus]
MTVKQRMIPTLKKVVLTASAVFALMQCSEEEILPEVKAPAAEQTSLTEANAETTISSLTITGLFTNLSAAKNCNCDYTVPADKEVIDGQELGIKPGNTICLSAKTKYGNLEFINMEGTEEKPIEIVNLGLTSPLREESLTANYDAAF